jgi:hypothetical protein
VYYAIWFTYIEYRDVAFALYIHRDPIYISPGSLGYASNRIVFYIVYYGGSVLADYEKVVAVFCPT